MAELLSLKMIKIGGSHGVVLPKAHIDEAKSNGSKKIWIVVLSHDESPNSEELVSWIRKK